MWKKNTGHGPFWRKQQESKQGKTSQRGMNTQDWEEFLNGEVFNEERLRRQRLDGSKVADLYEDNTLRSAPRSGPPPFQDIDPETRAKINQAYGQGLQTVDDLADQDPRRPEWFDNKYPWSLEPLHLTIGPYKFQKFIKEKATEEYSACMNENIGNPDKQEAQCGKWKEFSDNYTYEQAGIDHWQFSHHKKPQAWAYYRDYLKKMSPEEAHEFIHGEDRFGNY